MIGDTIKNIKGIECVTFEKWGILMEDEIRNYATGTVVPLGDGFTGKSVLSRLLINPNVDFKELEKILTETKKSFNIEIRFLTDKVFIKGDEIISTPQLYIFPGQRQQENPMPNTFEEILEIFDCFPALIKVSVLLLVYDVTNTKSFESLDMWLRFAFVKEWISENTLIILVSNKIDLLQPKEKDIEQAITHIETFLSEHELPISNDQIISIQTSCLSLIGIKELRSKITHWIAERGKKGIGTIEVIEEAKKVLQTE